ncbi:helix-turn-helix domain-containing protein [Amycolatopsis sp. NBC_00348]|uniref:helix-turn-helix domain-containing protein n=1 Tax=Amycolatopsis sp. NBC_00348 TaxID=2975956 RepID=UPI002E25C3A3
MQPDHPGRDQGPVGTAGSGTPPLPPAVAERLRPGASELARQLADAVRAHVPAYSGPADGPTGRAIRHAAEEAVQLFLDRITEPDVSGHRACELHLRIGRHEREAGHGLDSLQAAYRVGTRFAWRWVMRAGRQAEFPATVFAHLADLTLSLSDELVTSAVGGYREASESPESRRRRLLRVLLDEPSTPPEIIAVFAARAAWPVPDVATPIAITGDVSFATPPPPSDILAELDIVRPRLVVPGEAGPERIRTILAALPGTRLAIGPAVPLDLLGSAMRWTYHALELRDEPVVVADEHLPGLVVRADQALGAYLRTRLLRPMRNLTERQVHRQLETLHAWLDLRGDVPEMAVRLAIHPQTVRYRVRQLQRLYGTRMSESTGRLELELALLAGAGHTTGG